MWVVTPFFTLRADTETPTTVQWPAPSITPLGKYAKATVAADNQICSEIGRNVLLAGGNAADAAVAALFCLGATDAHSSGLGGGHFLTYYNATSQKCWAIDAREVAPLAATEDMYVNRWNDSEYGWRSIAVPGELHGLRTAYEKFGGKAAWSRLIEPTIQLARDGIPVSWQQEEALREQADWLKTEPTMHHYLENGKVKQNGDQVVRREFADTLQQLANSNDPIKLFYDSAELTQIMVEEMTKNGRQGLLTREDFRAYRSLLYEEKDLMVAVKFAYSGRTWLGDPKFVANATDIARNLTTKAWAEWVRTMITNEAHADSYYGGSYSMPVPDHGTTHLSVIDKMGNAVSVTSTINLFFGAKVASDALGIIWNDEMDDFSTPGHPNYFGYEPSAANFIKPGKRPLSSMTPLIIIDNDGSKRIMSVGAAGGSTIITGTAGIALHTMWLNSTVKEAVDFPRIHNQLEPNVTYYEEDFPKELIKALENRGQTMQSTTNLTEATGAIREVDGQLYANSDFRKGQESAPAGY
ncbi:unnamed protein product, partial [Mesorhabditis spiculigera]